MRIVIVFIISLLSVFLMTACGQSTAQPVMVDAFEGLDELERFPYEVKLPGHLPFKAIEASARIAREREPLGYKNAGNWRTGTTGGVKRWHTSVIY